MADPTAQQSIGSCLNDGPGGYVDDCSLQNACDFAPPPNPDIKPVFVKPKDLEPSTENLLQSGVGDRYLKEDGTIQKIQMNTVYKCLYMINEKL